MSRIDDLMADLCPDGVPFEALGKLVHRGTNIKWSEAKDRKFQYIDLTSVDRVTHKVMETESITRGNAPSRAQQIVQKGDILFGTTRPMLKRCCLVSAELNGQIASTGYCVLRTDTSRLLPEFLFHLLGTAEFYGFVEANERGASYPAIPDSVVKQFRIPVPPLKTQREIVRVLDTFAELETELETELEARKQQYAHYRDSLLAFHDAGVRRIPMGGLGHFIRGNGMQKNDLLDAGVPAIHYGQVHTHYSTWATEAKSYVSPTFASKLRAANPGDLVIATTSEDDEAVGKAVAWVGDEAAAVSGDAYIYRHNLDPKYVAYFFQTDDFQGQKKRSITGTKVRRVSGDALAKILIPVPDRAEQERIATILDKFDALVNDLSVGLPAELAARRQQYEYYRDSLLSFEESAA